MRKLIVILLTFFVSSMSFGQMAEVGYNTTDVGAEFQWYKDGRFIGLHLAANSKLHNSFHAMIGIYSVQDDYGSTYYYYSKKGGMGFGVGYRYYTNLRPHGFFVGVNANLFTKEVTMNTLEAKNYTSMIFIPSLQAGYMILINDLFFITPTVAGGYKTNLQKKLSADEKKAVGLLGISCGFKF